MHNSKLPPSPLALVRAICRRKEDLQPLSVLLIKYEPRRCAFSFSSTFQWLSAVVREGSECPPSQTRGRRKEGILINCHSSLRSPNDHRRRPFIKAAGFRGHEIIQKSACVVGTWSSPFSVTSFQMCVPIPEWTINLSRPSVRLSVCLAASPLLLPVIHPLFSFFDPVSLAPPTHCVSSLPLAVVMVSPTTTVTKRFLRGTKHATTYIRGVFWGRSIDRSSREAYF